MKQQFRFGRWLASIGSAAVTLIVAALAYGIVAETVAPEKRDPDSWGPALSPFTASCVQRLTTPVAPVVTFRQWTAHAQ
ncbi:hypothetical protein [Rhodococcus sp. ABRD24]|uniref:hypothetical protein n=1 Tax=Rhodococcus sp. ABRD24 TaxID=2507582 RepID=UPI0013F16E47|nr:hypothetical protein [Rhodococcus sp. ABRD24]